LNGAFSHRLSINNISRILFIFTFYITFLFFYQNKEFIYRGLEWEKIATFTQRLSAEFPNAQVSISSIFYDQLFCTKVF